MNLIIVKAGAPVAPFPDVPKTIYVKRVSQEQLRKLVRLGYTVVMV